MSNKLTNKDAPHCFVADLAKEARAAYDAHNWADEMILHGGKDEAHKNKLRQQMDRLWEKKEAIGDVASAFPAYSAVGAMYQLHLIDDLAGLIEGVVPENRERHRECEEWRAAIQRMCYSVRDFIAATLGADPDEGCAYYYLPKSLNPHLAIAKAIARQEVGDGDKA